MFSTPTSKAGSLFDLMRSSPSPASSSYQECHDHSSRTARSGAPSLQSKSPASIASFNSGSRYQPSSCSTYSASALPGSGLSRNIFKKQYIHQAIRLVDDALMEQEKGSSCDESYALDCYLGSLEYLLSAFSAESNLDRQIGSVERQAIVHAKLVSLIRRTEEFSAPHKQEPESYPTATEPSNGWWNGVWGRVAPSKIVSENTPIFVSAPSELAAQCVCGRKVLVKIPESMLPDTPTQEHLQQPEKEASSRGLIARLWGWILMGFFWTIGIINGRILPWIATFTIRTAVGVVIYLEKKFQIVNFMLNLVINTIKLLIKISRDYKINQQIGDLLSWIISHLLKFALAFVKQGDLEQLGQLLDVNPANHNHDRRKQDSSKSGAVNNNVRVLENLFMPQPHPSQTFVERGRSSSRFSLKSDATYQVNRPDHHYSNWTRAGTSSSSFALRPDSHRL
ncbi:hypothetical protein PCASD_07354 [Puccinia coronata f. sp. avenae]|uniref:MIT domain-containing protein n=1 Tax=Puccinia coronata f. sp. avenae TaxID=200324 RepID=A0A2N5UST7_9BASI|nr:hypothetical protein PCASD_07354 [Puccinia coronata f. sp. avenae]